MHRSRIGIVLVDYDQSRYDESLAFWAGVQGVKPVIEDSSASVGEAGTLNFVLRRLGDGTPSRVQLDIETDNIRAEVARLEGLGASVVEDRVSSVVMQDPGGVVFSVVGIQTGDRFTEDALEWP